MRRLTVIMFALLLAILPISVFADAEESNEDSIEKVTEAVEETTTEDIEDVDETSAPADETVDEDSEETAKSNDEAPSSVPSIKEPVSIDETETPTEPAYAEEEENDENEEQATDTSKESEPPQPKCKKAPAEKSLTPLEIAANRLNKAFSERKHYVNLKGLNLATDEEVLMTLLYMEEVDGISFIYGDDDKLEAVSIIYAGEMEDDDEDESETDTEETAGEDAPEYQDDSDISDEGLQDHATLSDDTENADDYTIQEITDDTSPYTPEKEADDTPHVPIPEPMTISVVLAGILKMLSVR